MSSHGSHAASTLPFAPGSRLYQGPFGRMFRNLPAWEPPGADEPEKILNIGTFAHTLVEPPPFDPGLDNPDIPSGYTYFGQFIDHDITFDPNSSLIRANDPDHLHNFRTPRFDLDNVYGRGPDEQPYLYRRDDPRKLLIGANGNGEPDLPRSPDDSSNTAGPFGIHHPALIGDPRNDENIIVSQVQLHFLEFHNARVDAGMGFEDARRSTRWHYQWVVIHDFLERLCGAELVAELLDGGTPGEANLGYYSYHDQPYIPVEFSVAAYRLGHSMIRGRYKLSDHLDQLRQGLGAVPSSLGIFVQPQADGSHLPDSLEGGRVLPPFWTIQWDLFLGDGAATQHSRKIDTKLAPPLEHLPGFEAAPLPMDSLPFRNLLRGWRLGLPSGQAVAKRMGAATVLAPSNSLGVDDPLWYYILREAETAADGRMLGEVGARIVGEVFVGLLASDPFSYFSMEPEWTPELAGAVPGTFDFSDFLRAAGAPFTAAEANARMGVPAPVPPAPAPVVPTP